MDAYYFPIFLVFLAVIVIWFYHRSNRANERRADAKYRRMQSRAYAADRVRRASAKKSRSPDGPAAGNTTPDKVWSSRHQRAKKKVVNHHPGHVNSKTYQASYLGPYEREQQAKYDSQSVQDQEVNKLDYVGFDEYITRQRVEAAGGEPESSEEFSMTAIKVESEDEVREEESSPAKEAGFKP
jgi:hypothetical protein